MRIIAIVNEKGGVGKTTTAVNLSAALGEMGQRILLVDLDGQAAASRWVGIEEDSRFADALLRGGGLVPIEGVMEGVSLAPGCGKLDSIAHDLRPTQGGQLRRVLRELDDRYDDALIDCPPSLGNRLIGNALLAATHAIAPVESSILALDGLGILLTTIQDVRDGFGHNIVLLGALACRYDRRTRLSKMVLAELKRALPGKVFNTVIRETVRIQECPASGKSILEHAPSSTGAEDYRALARELLTESTMATEREPSREEPTRENELTEGEETALTEFRDRAAITFAAPMRTPSAPSDLEPAAEDAEADPISEPEPPAAAPTEAPEQIPAAMASFPDRIDAEVEGRSEELVEAPCPFEEAVGEWITTDDSLCEATPIEQEAEAEEEMAAGASEEEEQPVVESSPPSTDAEAPAQPTTSGAGSDRRAMAVKATFPVLLLMLGLVIFWRATGGGEGAPQTASAESTLVSRESAPAALRNAVPADPDPQVQEADPEPSTEEQIAAELPATELASAGPSVDTQVNEPSLDQIRQELQETTSPALQAAVDTQETTEQKEPADLQELPGQEESQYTPCPRGFSLTCIMKTPDGYLAMVNGRAVRVGQVIDDAEVIDISLKSVEMQLDGKRFVLGIGEQTPADVPEDGE